MPSKILKAMQRKKNNNRATHVALVRLREDQWSALTKLKSKYKLHRNAIVGIAVDELLKSEGVAKAPTA